MNRLAHLLVALPLLALLAGCAEQQEEGAETISAAAAVQEIPITTSSQQARTVFIEGQQALDMGRSEDANALFKQAVQLDPKFTYAYVNVMATANSAEEFMKNLKAAEANMAMASQGEQLLVQFNRTFVDVDVAKRLELAQQLVQAYPTSPRALLTLANVQTGLDQIADARATMNKALTLDKSFAPTHIALGSSHMFNEPKDFAVAQRHMQHVVELQPNEPTAHVNLGDAYRAQKMLEQARDAYARAAELDPSSALALSKKGHANTFLGNFEAARSDFDAAIAAGTDQSKAAYASFKAYTYAYAGNPENAVRELGRVLERIDGMGIPADQITGAKINVLSNQATLAMHHGMYDVAQRALRQRTELIRADAKVVADEDFTRSQEANIALWDGLLAAYRRDFTTARAKAEEHSRFVQPQTNPRKLEGYHGLLGLIELKSGNPQAAVEHYKQANMNNIIIKHHYALALEGAGNQAEANRIFREVAEWNFNNAVYACIRNEAIKKIERVAV